MLFMILAHDKANSLDLRMKMRAAHLDYIKDAADRLKFAGPILSSGDDPAPIGSLLVLDAASEAAVRLFTENDPYATAGLFEAVEIRHWKGVVGDWIPSE
jgi:uncharacterized protein